MKVLPWFALLFAYTAVPADAHLTFAGTPKTDLFSSARLIDTNQSQSLEAVSTADGNLRLPSYKLAGVYFITGSNGQTFDNEAKDNDFTDPTGDYCQRLGFPVSSCASGLFDKPCPYNDKFFNRCCEATYIYSSSDCKSPRKLSSETCGGKHRCYCDTAQYPFASCNDPQIKGNACTDDGGTRYATCVCPNPVSTPYGCETYYAAPCGSVCKKAYADNCRNRNAVSIPSNASCSSYYSDCSSKCSAWKCNSGYKQSGNSCIQDCPIGAILYSDRTCSTNSVDYNKVAVAIVFDPSSKLAISLDENKVRGISYLTSAKSYSISGNSWCNSGKWTYITPTLYSKLFSVRGEINVSLMRLSKPQLYSTIGGLWVMVGDNRLDIRWGNQSGNLKNVSKSILGGARYVISY